MKKQTQIGKIGGFLQAVRGSFQHKCAIRLRRAQVTSATHLRRRESSIFRPGGMGLANKANGQTVETVEPFGFHGSLELRAESLHEPDTESGAFGRRPAGVDGVLDAKGDDFSSPPRGPRTSATREHAGLPPLAAAAYFSALVSASVASIASGLAWSGESSTL